MSPPNARAAGVATRGSLETVRAAKLDNSRDKEIQARLQALRALDRLDIMEGLAAWKLSLQRRLWQQQRSFLFDDCWQAFGPLETEVDIFVRVSRAFKQIRGRVL
jgi:hypothetical protein